MNNTYINISRYLQSRKYVENYILQLYIQYTIIYSGIYDSCRVAIRQLQSSSSTQWVLQQTLLNQIRKSMETNVPQEASQIRWFLDQSPFNSTYIFVSDSQISIGFFACASWIVDMIRFSIVPYFLFCFCFCSLHSLSTFSTSFLPSVLLWDRVHIYCFWLRAACSFCHLLVCQSWWYIHLSIYMKVFLVFGLGFINGKL